jgi:hypothetical protein
MLNILAEPNFEDDAERIQWIKRCKLWERKIYRLDDEMLLYLRERINYLLEVRSQKYLAEMEQDRNVRD